jgi:hypothetical protein
LGKPKVITAKMEASTVKISFWRKEKSVLGQKAGQMEPNFPKIAPNLRFTELRPKK